MKLLEINIPFNLNNLAQVLGSQSLKAFSVDPLTIILPEGFIAKLYIDSLLPIKLDATIK